MTGDVVFSARDAALLGAAALDRNVLASLSQLLIPKQSTQQALVVQCAVGRIPLRNGVARIDRSIALDTQEVAVVVSGGLNLRDQTIRLEFQPTVKEGLGLSATSLAQLIVLRGPLQAPTVGIDAAGAARETAKLGLAVATAGLSLAIPRAVHKFKGGSHCAQATGETAPAPDAI